MFRMPSHGQRGRAGLVGVGLLVTIALTSGCAAGEGDRPAPVAASTPSETPAAQPVDPDSPVLCSRISLCFPASVTGPEFLDRVHRNAKWTCTKKGAEDIYGEALEQWEQGICQKEDGRSRPYLQKADISWDTDTHEPTGTLASVSVSASTQYRESKGQTPEAKNTLKLAPVVFDVAIENLWPDNASLQREAKQALAKVLPECAARRSRPEEREVLIPTGYKVSCSDLAPISVKYPDGAVTTITVLMRFDVPSVREWSPPTGQ